MQIDLIYDSAASAAPQSFRDAIQTAANILDSTFTDAITVNVEVGYGVVTVNGVVQDTLTNGDAETVTFSGDYYSYSSVRADLAGSVDSAVLSGVAALPNISTIQGQSRVMVWSAEEKALGLIAANDPSLDAAVGFATDVPAANLVGVALHELTHALGRDPSSGSVPDIFDFYRFTSPWTRLFSAANTAPPSYFSLDNGQTPLADYGQTSDPGDFLNGSLTPNDAFNEFYGNSTLNGLTAVDLLQMEALGFHVAQLHFGPTDLALRQATTGDWGFMSTTADPAAWHAVGPSSTAYTAMGTGDFNGDGQYDLAFRQTTTGDWGFLTPNLAGGGETWHSIGPTSTQYAVAAIADFNRDGATDIAFRSSSTGDLGYMSVNASGGETWHAIGPTSTDYAVMGAGDYNGDGVVDIAFRQVATGDWGFMSVNPGGGETWHAVGPTSTAYAAIGVGDFGGTGVADVAFRNQATGDWGYMSVNPSGGETWHSVGSTSLAYAAVKVADFNGDGLADIAFRNSATGDWGYMTANPSGGETWHPMGSTSTDYFAVA